MTMLQGADHNEKKLFIKKLGHQKFHDRRPRRIVEESQLRAVQCRLSPLLFRVLELGIDSQGKYEEERKKKNQIVGRGPAIYT